VQRDLFTLASRVFRGHPPYYLAPEDRRRIVSAFEPGNDALFAEMGMANPYGVASLDFPAEAPRSNVSLKDLMMLLADVLDSPGR
jgi:hypothetical protein